MARRLSRIIRARTATVVVIGLGYVGLPLAEAFARVGFRVLGIDNDAGRVECLNRDESYLSHIPAERISALRAAGRFEASTDPGRLCGADAFIICVPTPITPSREPDLSCVRSAMTAVARALRPGRLVVLESTTYPGTTEEVVRPLLERSGLRAGRDFFLAYSPEREDPGNKEHATTTIPKVVGGVEPAGHALAVALYESIVGRVVPVSSARVAEACKILENTYCAVNIALVNELKVVFERMNIDIWEVIEAARTKPFGFQAFYPGPGVGGHCIAVDPHYLSWAARAHGVTTRFIDLAGETNAAMPEWVAARVAVALNEQGKPVKGSRVCLLGAAYKKDVGDARESPALPLLARLESWGGHRDVQRPPHDIPAARGRRTAAESAADRGLCRRPGLPGHHHGSFSLRFRYGATARASGG